MKNKRLIIFLLIITLLSLLSVYYPQLTGQATNNQNQVKDYLKEEAILTRVIDGDTIKVIFPSEGQEESIRLLGINTPEKKMPHANASSSFLKEFENNTIYLLRDKENTDKYNRKLRYLFYEDRFVNLEILEKGFANAYYYSDLIYEKELLRAETQARELGLGIWEKSQEVCANCITLVNLNATSETFLLENSCDFNCKLEGWFVKDAGRNILYLKEIKANQKEVFNSSKDVWNNYGDAFFLFDKQGKLVLYHKY
ncbi:thermonuclease family protein [Candidatus Pacearchaeota archaeon]|nr:thermonuclease family protein [Candidatus Pacearchaeota archaeon]